MLSSGIGPSLSGNARRPVVVALLPCLLPTVAAFGRFSHQERAAMVWRGLCWETYTGITLWCKQVSMFFNVLSVRSSRGRELFRRTLVCAALIQAIDSLALVVLQFLRHVPRRHCLQAQQNRGRRGIFFWSHTVIHSKSTFATSTHASADADHVAILLVQVGSPAHHMHHHLQLLLAIF